MFTKTKKLISIILAVVLVATITVAISACGHTHTFDKGWEQGETTHWHKATCEHTDKKDGEAKHTFGSDNKCTVCGYERKFTADYTIKVVDEKGSPVTGVTVQPCEVTANGGVGVCHAVFKPVDATGTVAFCLDIDVPEASVEYFEFHVHGLPYYLKAEEVDGNEGPRLHKGESATIVIKGNFSDLIGDGTEATPYNAQIASGLGAAYKIKFTAADQKIYFAFNAKYADIYKVYAVGGELAIKAADDTTAVTGADYEFDVDQDDTIVVFEISLADATKVNEDIIIRFEYRD